ncbi:MAG: DUF1223 domain-containing protein [Shimia sp.]
MRIILTAILILCGASAAAERHPVVVELYTSQGCSSCPPADAMLHELSRRHDVIGLALHVDYWDYIGWADSFARPEHTARQKAYARAAGEKTIYTPQMVINGTDHVIGTRPDEVAVSLAAHMAAQSPLVMAASRDGALIRIRLEPMRKEKGAFVVQVATYVPGAEVEVRRGENAGRTLRYANIVTSWRAVSAWDGASVLEVEDEVAEDTPAVVIVQVAGHGAILGAAALD